MIVQDLFENRMHDAYSVFQQLAAAVNLSKDVDLQIGHEMMPIAYWQARYLLGQYRSIAKSQGPDAGMRFLADYNAVTAALDAMDTRLGQTKHAGSLPGQRAVDETHDYDEPEECDACHGTGEGQFDGTSCGACGGSGIVRPNRDDDDFDIPYDYDMREAAPDPKHLQRYGHELDQRFPDISNSVTDRGVTVPNSKEVARQTARPNKHHQSTPFHTNGAKLATVVRPGSMPPRVKRLDPVSTPTRVKRLDTPTTVPNFLKKPMAREDARPGPLERSAPHTQKKTTDQLTHLQALNGLEETVSLMRAANRRISENLSLMEFDPTGFGHGGRGQGPNYERLRRLASRWWSANTEERRLQAEGELEALGYEIHELETGQQGVQLTPYGDYHIDDVVEFLVQDLYEAGSPAQQAAIAIAMKKAGKKPKNKGVAEGSLEEIDRRGFLRGMGAAAMAGVGGRAMAQSNQPQDLGNGFALTTVDVSGRKVRAVLDTQSNISYTPNKQSDGFMLKRTQAPFLLLKNGEVVNTAMNVGSDTATALQKAGLMQDMQEAWSQKYKKSINCSHPKGFSQKAHCAGKKKHTESMMTMEATCPDCGMCQTHGNINEIKKGAKDSNGFTRCWPGKHAEGTKKGKNGGQVRNCVPNESQGVAEAEKKSQYEMMMRNGQVKKFIAKDDADAKRIAAGHGAKSVIRMKGGVPAGKVSEQGVAEDLKQPMKMADYEAQADRLHDEMMRYQHANDEAGYERAKQAYLALERQARQGMVPETAAIMPPSPAAAAQAKAIVQKAADDRAVSLARMAGVVPDNVEEDSGAWPFQEINELSNDKLAQYKSAAGRAATAADRAGNYELGNKRFKGIVQATKKQFANDIAKHYDKATQR